MGAICGVILDVDGTLVDSNDAHAQAWVEALSEHGCRVPFERVRSLIGMGGDRLMPMVCGIEQDSALGQRIDARRREIFSARHLPRLRAFPDALELLRRMRDGELRLAVASSAQSQELRGLLAVVGAGDLIEEQTSSSDAEHSKPDPDIVRVALQQLGCPPAAALMLGDTPYDIEAAGRAGVATIALRCGGWDDQSLAGALAIYDDPADLLARYDDSPLARQADRGAR